MSSGLVHTSIESSQAFVLCWQAAFAPQNAHSMHYIVLKDVLAVLYVSDIQKKCTHLWSLCPG